MQNTQTLYVPIIRKKLRFFNIFTVIGISLIFYGCKTSLRTGFWSVYVVAGIYLALGLWTAFWRFFCAYNPKSNFTTIERNINFYKQNPFQDNSISPKLCPIKEITIINGFTVIGIIGTLLGVILSAYKNEYAWISYLSGTIVFIIGFFYFCIKHDDYNTAIKPFIDLYTPILIEKRADKKIDKIIKESNNRLGYILTSVLYIIGLFIAVISSLFLDYEINNTIKIVTIVLWLPFVLYNLILIFKNSASFWGICLSIMDIVEIILILNTTKLVGFFGVFMYSQAGLIAFTLLIILIYYVAYQNATKNK